MPWTVSDPPAVAKNWTADEQRRCVSAANDVLARGGEDAESRAIHACIAAAGHSNQDKERETMDTLTDIKELSLDALREAIHRALNPPMPEGIMPMGKPMMYRWIKELYKDRVIVQTENPDMGCHIYEIPYSVNSKDEITFGEPIEVEMIYTPKGSKEAAEDEDEGEGEKATKREGGVDYPKGDFAYTPSDQPSTWKLRLTKEPGKLDAAIIGAAAAALGPGFRGQKVDIPDEDRAAVVARVRAAWKKANPDKDEDEMPEGLKEGKRMMARMREKLKAMMGAMQEMMRWANYEDGEEELEPEKGKPAAAGKALDHGFKVYRDKAGRSRWVAWTTNGFQDRDQETFTTKALEQEVARSDKDWPEEQRGLWLWHIPGSQFGQTDWRGVIGRILVESGTFDDSPRGQKALAYFLANQEEDLKMSHGYRYQKPDREDSVYEWLEIVERSVLPGAAAANPWTQFTAKEVRMPLTEEKRAALKTIFGAEEAAAIEKAAEEKTKELEEKGIAYKDGAAAAAASEPVAVKEEAAAAAAAETPAAAPVGEPALDVKALADALLASPAIVAMLGGQKELGEAIAAIQTAVAALEPRLAKVEVQHGDAVKAVLADLPSRAFYRASQDAATAVKPDDPEGQKLVQQSVGKPEANPSFPLNAPIR